MSKVLLKNPFEFITVFVSCKYLKQLPQIFLFTFSPLAYFAASMPSSQAMNYIVYSVREKTLSLPRDYVCKCIKVISGPLGWFIFTTSMGKF